MFELLVFLIFAASLFIFGISVLGMSIAFAISILLMMLFGMLAFMFKLAPWLIILAIAIWWFRKEKV